MFTGIIQEKGLLKSIKKIGTTKRIIIKAPKSSKKLKKGDSLAVNGACLTMIEKKNTELAFDIIEETLKKSHFQKIKENDTLNLELPLRYGDLLSGHLILGHIDGTGTVKKITREKIEIEFPKKLTKFITQKGCIAINGASLTVAEKKSRSFTIALTPYTGKNTNLGNLHEKEKVNMEIDLFARYLGKCSIKQTNKAIYETIT